MIRKLILLESFAAIALTILCRQGPSWGVDLNAPAVKPVTIKSEIQRGGEAIVDTPWNPEDVLASIRAINNTLDREQQKNTDTDAFYLGAYFTAFLNTVVALQNPGLQDPQALELARRDANLWYKEFRQSSTSSA